MSITRGYFFGILRDYYIVLLCHKIQKPSCDDHTTFIPFCPRPKEWLKALETAPVLRAQFRHLGIWGIWGDSTEHGLFLNAKNPFCSYKKQPPRWFSKGWNMGLKPTLGKPTTLYWDHRMGVFNMNGGWDCWWETMAGGFRKWGYPNSWMKMDDFGVPPWIGKLHWKEWDTRFLDRPIWFHAWNPSSCW